uniref:Mitochondria bc1 complex core subunit 1 n=1 Tax=Brugia malayi TaxID=6279 RepID=Q75PZ4_BRUMA|nr:mitochondria bc1 complex core subunit 1 [Brugia malayi]
MSWRSLLCTTSKTLFAFNGLHLSLRATAVYAARDVLSSISAPEVTSLKNGFRVVTETNQRPTIAVGVWIDSGSRFENEANNGISNFLEHMMYRGTKKRSQTELETELEKIGARFDSYTSRDHNAFYVQCVAKHVENVVALLADVLQNSKLEQATLETERTRILCEINKAAEDPSEMVFDYLHNAAFQGTPMAKSVYGTEETVRNLTRNDLRKYIDAYYKPSRMVLGAVGNIEHSQIVNLAERYFDNLSTGQSGNTLDSEGIRFTGSEFIYRNDDMPFMYGALAVEGVGFSHPDAIPLKVASAMIGDWDCTQLSSTNAATAVTQKISTGYGVHQLKSFSINYGNCGLFGFYVVMDGSDVASTTFGMKEVIRGWKRLAIGVSEEEIERGKNMYKTVAFSALESSVTRVDDIAKQVLYSDPGQSLADLENAIENVDKKAISEAINKHVYDRDLAVAGIGRTEAWPDYYQLRIGMSAWRL